MPISFTCPFCGRFTEVSDDYAGQSGPCAGCGQTITIPTGAGPAPLKTSMPPARPAGSNSNTALIVAIVLGVMCLCGGGGMVALLLPAVQAAREASRRMQCVNNLKQIALAMHNYHDTYKCFPAGYIADEDGKPMHSWRVAILPFIEQSPLYDMYDFNEPWDSPANQLVANRMPETFRCPSAPETGPGSNLTHYVVVLHNSDRDGPPDTVFGKNRWTRIREVTDGTSNTLMVAEVKNPVPWTQPDTDLHFDTMNMRINGGPSAIGSYHPGGANAAFCDGSVQFLSDSVDSQTLRSLLQPADGQAVRYDQY